MKNVEFIEYFKVISEILKETKNQELSTKLFKVLVVTGSIQNILIASKLKSEECTFSNCAITLKISGIRCSEELKRMFKFRNRIAHINDLVNIMRIFNEVDMKNLDKEFETVITILDIFNPIDFPNVENRIAIDSMTVF